MAQTPQSFIWYELVTPDAAAAERFYTGVVGWTAEPFGGTDSGYTVLKAGAAGVAGIMQMPGAHPGWLGYVHAADVDAAVQRIVAEGGAVHREPTDIPDVGRFAVVADPQGAIFMLMAPKGEEQPPLAFMTPGDIGWRELLAGDGEQAFAFYSRHFGWTKTDDMDMGDMGIYRLFDSGRGQGGGMMTKPAHVPQPNWMFYFNVETLDAAVERVGAHGGTVVFGPQEVPGGAWIVNCVDPQGGMFALVAPKR